MHNDGVILFQVNRCEEVSIDACTWNSETPESTKQMIARDILSGQPSYKLLYTTPESLRLPTLREALLEAAASGCLMSFAIDEVSPSSIRICNRASSRC